MPRPPIENVTHAGTDTVVLNVDRCEQIAKMLVASGFDREKASRFSKATNGAVVVAYELEHHMSTPGALRRWHGETLKAIERHDVARIRKLLGESADEFEGRFQLECQLLANTGALPVALGKLRAYSEVQLTRLSQRERRTPRSRTCRQMLAENLVSEWRLQFGENPVYWIEKSLPPFLGVLKEVMLLAEIHYFRGLQCDEVDKVTEDVLRGLAKRACSAEKQRTKAESQFSL